MSYSTELSSLLKSQLLNTENRDYPDYLIACVGGGSNAAGLYYNYLENKNVKIIEDQAAGKGISTGESAATSILGKEGIIHGSKTLLMQNKDGQITEPYSISAGLDYPGIGPEHSYLHDLGRIEYVSIQDDEALMAFQLCCEKEGIIPALEPSHALAYVTKIAPLLPKDHIMIMNMCGRGDKDIFTVADALDFKIENL